MLSAAVTGHAAGSHDLSWSSQNGVPKCCWLEKATPSLWTLGKKTLVLSGKSWLAEECWQLDRGGVESQVTKGLNIAVIQR